MSGAACRSRTARYRATSSGDDLLNVGLSAIAATIPRYREPTSGARAQLGEVTRRDPRPEPRRHAARGLEEPDHARPMAAPRLQELQHSLIGGARLTGKRPGHHMRQVGVADADRIGIAEGAQRDLRGGPRPDPRVRA